MKKERIELSRLKDVSAVLEIRPTDQSTVSRYRQALRHGEKFPPLVRDQDNNLIAGYHRRDMYREEHGPDYEVDVVTIQCENDLERLVYAVQDNLRHGRPIEGYERRMAIVKLINLGMKDDQICDLFKCSVKSVQHVAGMTVVLRGGATNAHGDQELMPLKRGAEHIAGRTVTVRQYEQHVRHDVAVPIETSASQLTRWIKNRWVDMENERSINALRELHDELKKFFEEID
jgi:hypothetical protein